MANRQPLILKDYQSREWDKMDVPVENWMIETVVNVVVEARSEFDYANNEINETPLGTCPALAVTCGCPPL